nr:PREDICTED: oxysterol-binding protein-related protein 10 [Latimeria chalumnae]|eukprot:XP_014351054.1 PREDICTED: oxysterol-binding protein-related protein 10 [Latimeria chalumnae]
MRENQCGFRPGRGCIDQIFVLWQFVEKHWEWTKELHVCFIDFAQAYVSVWREGVRKLLPHYGIPSKIARMLKALYKKILACVRIEGVTSEWFDVVTGVRQGCIISPLLFNIVLDYVLRRAFDNPDQEMPRIHIGDSKISDLEDTDDAALIAQSVAEIEVLAEHLNREAKKWGLRISIEKTKVMSVVCKEGSDRTVMINKEPVERVDRFVYLGSEIAAKETCATETGRRIALAGMSFAKFDKILWKSQDVSLKTKLRVFNASVVPVLPYGCESWNAPNHIYFVLDTESGALQYFVNEQSKSQKPRGVLPLAEAVVSLSDEAPYMFQIHSGNGDLYKLRAADAKERQYWVSQLQACAKYHTEALKGTLTPRARSFSLLPHGGSNSASPSNQRHLAHSGPSIVTITHHKSPAAARKAKNRHPGHFNEVKEIMSQVEGQQKNLVHTIESLPSKGPLSALDQDLLLLKATSAATLGCLGECFNILQQSAYQVGQNKNLLSDNFMGWHGPKSHSAEHLKTESLSSLPSACVSSAWSAVVFPAPDNQRLQQNNENPGPEVINPEDEVTDTEDNDEEDLGVMDEQRSVILHLLSQLKLGMDLTRVVLPTFILEKRSLLEMYANFMAHPDLFVSITAGVTPEDRIIRFVEYYLTAFHEGRKGAVAKKPYNPIIGEAFHCSWDVPKDKIKSIRTNSSSTVAKEQAKIQDLEPDRDQRGCYKVRFVAEQVSHHPPVSGFYSECKERNMCVNAHVWTKSKFMGMSIGVSMVGEGVLYLVEHGEEYVFTLPSAYARSILTVPWVELGGKVGINCAKTGYSATVTFHTKPFYGGKVHRLVLSRPGNEK